MCGGEPGRLGALPRWSQLPSQVSASFLASGLRLAGLTCSGVVHATSAILMIAVSAMRPVSITLS